MEVCKMLIYEFKRGPFYKNVDINWEDVAKTRGLHGGVFFCGI